MIGDFFIFYEKNIFIIYMFHILISFILAFVMSNYLLKRFILKSEDVDKIDLKRVEEW